MFGERIKMILLINMQTFLLGLTVQKLLMKIQLSMIKSHNLILAVRLGTKIMITFIF